MIDYILNVIIRKFIIMMDNINTVINFIIILASFIMVIKVFLDLSHIQKAFLDFRLTFTRLIKVYWLTRSNRQKYIRLYIELFIIRSGAKKVTKQMFKTISDEFISLRDRDNPEIEVADCSFLITERFNESVKQYFDYFSKPNNMSTFMIPEDKPVSFISNITIKEGFLSPYVLIDGLITRYADDWPGILDKYKLFFNDSGDVDSQDLSSLFCWLLWGPSWQPVFNKKSYAIFNYSFGDENNAIPVILPAHQNSFA
ncbi:MAG: hypothetical protein FWB83_04165, partial [Treponema sp.]|nr:hypothetical protein [Treponema sp.]